MKTRQNISLLLFIFILSASLALPSAAGEEIEYPELYGTELPRYQNAELIDIGRQQKSLRDGLRLKLNSPDPVGTIAAFFEKKMEELSWEFPESRFTSDKMYMKTFTKGDLYYQLSIMRLDPAKNETEIRIIYAEK